MEEWEKELREQLREELPEGCYDVSSPGIVMYTGKGGKIESVVAIHKEMRKMSKDFADAQAEISETHDGIYEDLTLDKLKEIMRTLYADETER